MASAKRIFYCAPRRMIRDNRLAALDHRVIGAVSLHDGMSLVKGKGGGCFAAYKTLSGEVGCDYTNFSKSISRLMRWGYAREARAAIARVDQREAAIIAKAGVTL